eukprot:SAG31_NODE_22920_length_515_cov_0.995192_1_plen_26_part_01
MGECEEAMEVWKHTLRFPRAAAASSC